MIKGLVIAIMTLGLGLGHDVDTELIKNEPEIVAEVEVEQIAGTEQEVTVPVVVEVKETDPAKLMVDQSYKELKLEVLRLVNEIRVANGLGTVVWEPRLEQPSLTRATEIQILFEHVRPDGSAWHTVNSDLCWGENLAKGYSAAQPVVDAWMNSPTHREVILTPEFTSMCLGVTESNGQLFMAQHFGIDKD